MDYLANNITDFFVEKKIIDNDMRDVYKYGFELLLADIVNFSLILIISILFRSLVSGLIFLLCFTTLRSFCGGYHAKTHNVCRLVMMCVFLSVLLCGTFSFIHSIVSVLTLNIISTVTIILFAPVENKNKPLSDKKKLKNRRRSLFTVITYSCVSITLIIAGRNEGVIISLTLLIVSILIIVEKINQGKEVAL